MKTEFGQKRTWQWLILGMLVCVIMVSGLSYKTAAAEDTQANARKVYEYLTGTMGLNSAAACGIMANMDRESGFNADIANPSSGAYGLCQWLSVRFYNLVSFCEERGLNYRTVEGQVRFLHHEVTTISSFQNILPYLKNVSNTAQGAYDAGYYWCRYFEIPSDIYFYPNDRGNHAKTDIWPVYGRVENADKGALTDAACAVSLQFTSYPYTGGLITPSVTVSYSHTTLAKNRDYTVSYASNRNVGTASVTVRGKGDYTGTVKKTFVIRKRPLTDTICRVSLQANVVAYNGKARTPGVTVKFGTVMLKQGTDFTVKYANHVNAGKASVTVTGKGNFQGTVRKTFTIAKGRQNISVGKTTLTYSRAAQDPAITGAEGKITLISSDPSIIAVSGKKLLTKKCGKVQITIRAAASANCLAASKTVVMVVRPEAPVLVSAEKAGTGKARLVITSPSSPDGYQIQFAVGPVFQTAGNLRIIGAAERRTYTFSGLKSGVSWIFRVRSYKEIDGQRCFSSWSSIKTAAL